MSISRYHLAVSLSVVAAFVLSATVVRAQAGGTIVHPDPATIDVGQGQIETINIVIDNAQAAYGIDVRAKFDPNVIEVVDADPDTDGVQMTPGTFIKPDFIVRNSADNQQGTLQYVVTQVNPSPPATGSGVILSLQVRGKTLGAHTALSITSLEIADRLGHTLPAQMQDAAVDVVAPKPQTPTPISSPVPTIPSAGALISSAPTNVAVSTPNPDFPYVEITLTPTPTIAAVAAVSSAADPNMSQLLALIAVGGGLGAVALLIFAAIVIRRRARPTPRS